MLQSTKLSLVSVAKALVMQSVTVPGRAQLRPADCTSGELSADAKRRLK
jgi:hypothetical protein